MDNCQLNRSKGNTKKGIYTFDLLFAVLVIFIIFYIEMLILTEINDKLISDNKEFAGKTKAFLISEKLITRDLVYSDTQSYQNYLDPNKLSNTNITKYLKDFRISAINISSSFSTAISEGNFNKPNTYCYTRIVLVRGILSDYPGRLSVCIQSQ